MSDFAGLNALGQPLPPAEFERRFGGSRRLYGGAGAERLFGAHVVVVGLGGVGSWAAEALVRAGVGEITLIDLDHIGESNINRQLHARSDTLGQAKVEAMRDRALAINPGVKLHLVDDFVTPQNWAGMAAPWLVPGQSRLAVLDACDAVAAKTCMAAWALQHGVLHIAVGAAGGKRLAHQVQIADLSETTHDPLLAQLRYRLRKHHGAGRQGAMGVPCVFSREAVAPPAAPEVCGVGEVGPVPNEALPGTDHSLNCHGYGSSVAVTATFGLCAAGWVMEQLATGARAARPARRKKEGPSKTPENDAII